MRESAYQTKLIKKLNRMFPGCIILKNNPQQIQGIPDLVILFKNCWAALEIKKSSTAESRPNQKYYVEQMQEMSFASFIYPENEDEVLNELQLAFGAIR